jgi:hypothetical protein
MTMPAELRARLAVDYTAVRPLQSPFMRALWVTPFAVLALLAAPTFFNVRADVDVLGWTLSWGASLFQASLGFAVIAAALREAVPGRAWNGAALTAWITVPLAVLIAVTLISSQISPVALPRGFWMVGLLCLGGSAATALPVVAIANVLAARAYPTRPGVTGVLLGLGAGLMADGGWRMFCHYSEPSHVLSAHLGGVIAAVLAGAALAVTLRRPFQ